MPRLALALSPALLVGALALAGCNGSAPPAAVAKKQADVGPALPAAKGSHDDHDHAGHDHASHGSAPAEALPADEGEAHDHHHPETLAELVGELDKLVAVVKEGMEANVREKADAPVHELGHFLGDVEGLAKEAKLPADVEAGVIAASEALFTAFDKIDIAIHGADDLAKVWGDEAAGIEAGMKTLKDAVAK
ncbi:MAG: hypothetical protein NT171_21400 [Planctomycetota bacterium]|nr:hypothetical protein [Planctomycetota bacterium]